MTAFGQLKKRQQCMLYEWHSRRRFEIRPLLLPDKMWCVIGRNNIDAALVQCGDERCLVLCCFYGRVALDLCAEVFVTALIEPQVMHTDLRRNPFVTPVCFGEQAHFDCSGQVKHVKPCIVTAGQFHRET